MTDATAAKVSWVAENVAPGRAGRERRQDETERRERDDRGERRRRSLGVEARDSAAKRHDEEAEADDAVRGDHRCSEHGVARERVGLSPAGRHERDDETDLDDGHGDCENERPERLAHAMRHDLRVMDGREDRAGEKGGDEGEDDVPGLASPRRGEGDQGNCRNDERPRHGTCDPHRYEESTAQSGARPR